MYLVIWNFNCADVATSGVNEVREAWESRRKAYTSEFLEFDPCIVSCCYFLSFLDTVEFLINSCLFSGRCVLALERQGEQG